MRLRTLLLLLLTLFPVLPIASAHAQPTTVAETAALEAAKSDHTAYTLPPDKLAKAEALAHIGTTLHFGGTLWRIVTLLLILQLGVAARMRNVAVNLSKKRWVQGLIFFFEFLLLTSLLNLPLSLYGHHVGLAYGFSIQHWGSWFWDQIKGFVLTYVVGGLFVLLLFWIIRKSPRRWWLWLWFPTMAMVLFGVYVSPYVVDPLFNKFVPLQQSNPALVEQLERVAGHSGRINIPPRHMFLMLASNKVTVMNAYVTGFGSSKRLVIWDTLLRKSTPDEILLTAGHEMGHYVLGHVLRGTLFSFVFILVSFFVGFHLFQWMLRRMGARWRIPAQDNWAALVVLVLVLSVINFLGEPIRNSFSRGMEHDADVFGQEAIHGIVADPQATGQASFQRFGEDDLEDPTPSAFVEFWTYTHPSAAFRAAFAKHYDPWAPGMQPKYLKR